MRLQHRGFLVFVGTGRDPHRPVTVAAGAEFRDEAGVVDRRSIELEVAGHHHARRIGPKAHEARGIGLGLRGDQAHAAQGPADQRFQHAIAMQRARG